jgi:hypothetical protein
VYVIQGEKGSFQYHHTESEVVALIGTRAFRDKALPFLCDTVTPYRGWNIRWLTGKNAGKTSVIESYDVKCRTVTLKGEIGLDSADRFAVYPQNANWQIHHNTFADCKINMIVEPSASDGVHLKDNI